jgi:hypothetical protein
MGMRALVICVCLNRTHVRACLQPMVQLLLALHRAEIDAILELGNESGGSGDVRRSRRLLRELSLRNEWSVADMILAGFDARHEPWLRSKVAAVMRDALERAAHGRFTVPGSLSPIGVPDWSGSLAEGTVALLSEGKWGHHSSSDSTRRPGLAGRTSSPALLTDRRVGFVGARSFMCVRSGGG